VIFVLRLKKELKIDYYGLVCASCNHPIIWEASDQEGEKHAVLKHIDYVQYRTTEIIKISKECRCGCIKARD
jgi:hypothetical protein